MRILAAIVIALAILIGSDNISRTLDEVCPTVEEGTEFLSARAT